MKVCDGILRDLCWSGCHPAKWKLKYRHFLFTSCAIIDER